MKTIRYAHESPEALRLLAKADERVWTAIIMDELVYGCFYLREYDDGRVERVTPFEAYVTDGDEQAE